MSKASVTQTLWRIPSQHTFAKDVRVVGVAVEDDILSLSPTWSLHILLR